MQLNLPLFKIVQRPLLPINESWVDATPLLLLLLLLFASVWAARRLRRAQLVRHIIQALGLFIFVIFLHRCLCALRGWAFGLKLLGRNDLIAFGHLCIFIILAAFTIAYGRYFCGWVCPLGTIQELLGTLGIARRRRPKLVRLVGGYLMLAGLGVALVYLAWLVAPRTQYASENVAALAGLLLLVVLAVVLPWEERDWRLRWLKYASAVAWVSIAAMGVFVTNPWCVLYGNEVDYSSFVSLLAVSAVTVVISMAWCRYLCPLGGLLAACSTFARFRIGGLSACKKCGRCVSVCPVGALNVGQIEFSYCTYCGRCIEACGFVWEDRLSLAEAAGQGLTGGKPAAAVHETGGGR